MNVCDKVILGGGMIFIFFKVDGKSIGFFFVEEDKIGLVKNFVVFVKEKGVEFIFLVDVLVVDKYVLDVNI